MTLEEAKTSIEYVRVTYPEKFEEMGGSNITDEKIEEAHTIIEAIAGALDLSDDELLKKELTRICNDVPRG